ncbi:symplekin tight junction protein [Hamiltosporidium magnivora]|uniref:Symplekin tight junction protein n=1 Tax=Hamiltosporidium magnivora TaxID=148818 RepID=A0A4Q9LDH1_9MICR|nr:symplekin tight junction protein [Hamiltosporidium magnivora]
MKNEILKILYIPEYEIADILAKARKMNPSDFLLLLSTLYRIINKDNCKIIFPFILDLSENPLELDPIYHRSFSFHFKCLLTKIKYILPESFTFLYENIENIKFKTKKISEANVKTEKKFLPFEFIYNIVLEALVTASSKEIENIIDCYFGSSKEDLMFKPNFISEILKNMVHLKEDKNINNCIKYIANILSKDDTNQLLDFLNQNYSLCNIFFLTIFLYNFDVYKNIEEVVLSTQKYFNFEIITALIEIDIQKVFNFIDESKNEDIKIPLLKNFIENRPKNENEIIQYLKENKIQKDLLVEFFKEYFCHFKSHINEFEFTLEEQLSIAECDDTLFYDIYNNNLNELNKTMKYLTSRNDEFIFSFFSEICSQNTNFNKNTIDESIIWFLRYKKLPENLKSLFVKRLSDNSAYFFALIFYLEKEQIMSLMELFLVDQTSLQMFLKVLSSKDILLNIHFFSDLKKTAHSIQLCLNNKDIFNEHVFIYVITTLEDGTLPPLFMRTVVLALNEFPNLKKFIFSLLFRLSRRKIWQFPKLFEGFIKCLAGMGSSSVEVIMTLPEDIAREIIFQNNKLRKYTEDYVSSTSGYKKKSSWILKNILKSIN